jgi:hypothetical protein
MKKSILILLSLPLAALFSSCQTTGDPNAGGIFWSKDKAQQRLDDRQQHLDDVNYDIRRKQNSAAVKEKKIRSMQ